MQTRISLFLTIVCTSLVLVFSIPLHAFGWNDLPSEQDISRVRKKLETLRAWELTKYLELNEETSARLFPAIRDADEQRLKIQAENRGLVRRMRESLEADSPLTEEINEYLDRLQQNRKEMARIEVEHMERVRSILSTEDTARYLLFLVRFQREVRERISKASQDRRKNRSESRERD